MQSRRVNDVVEIQSADMAAHRLAQIQAASVEDIEREGWQCGITKNGFDLCLACFRAYREEEWTQRDAGDDLQRLEAARRLQDAIAHRQAAPEPPLKPVSDAPPAPAPRQKPAAQESGMKVWVGK